MDTKRDMKFLIGFSVLKTHIKGLPWWRSG